jgi:(4-(4-[2-(gamma-L-glutamylamino)ethyl]phenoxymethyl)furan-2-yl)methanamine synthase
MTVIGWDIGGANVKIACVASGRVTQVAQIPCPLLADRTKFDEAIAVALIGCPYDARHAVTMTGELSDVFANRAEGVAYLVALMRETTGDQTQFYGGREGFLDADDAVAQWRDVASANWHASAALVARRDPDALLLDIGTTTTDIIPLTGGEIAARGFTDGERLAEGELVYTGVVRTPVMAVAQVAPFLGLMQRIAAERFATMADVHRLTGDLPESADPYQAADLRGKSVGESAARLARMLGRDASEADLPIWTELARYFADCQLAQIEAAARELIAREALIESAPIVGAGCGRFLAKRLAASINRPYRDFAETIDCVPEMRDTAACCAPAVAVALLREAQPVKRLE